MASDELAQRRQRSLHASLRTTHDGSRLPRDDSDVRVAERVDRRLSRRIPALRLTVFAAVTTVVAAVWIGPSPAPGATGSPSLTIWNVAAEPSPTGSWSAVDFADGQWIALGHTSDVAVSSNGSKWTEFPVPAGSWQTVTYGNGQFVALSSVDASPEELVSTNGVNWTALAGPAGSWTGLTFAEGRFVAVSSHGQIVTSTDGVHWIEPWYHSNYDLTSVAYGNGQFVAVDSALGALIYSPTGLDWHRLLAPKQGLKWGAVAYGNGNFVAFDGSGSGYYATSVYGYVWTLHRYAPAQEISAATFGCGEFVAAGQSTGSTSDFFSSQTGSTWSATAVPIDEAADWTAVSYGAHRFVAVDNAGNIVWSGSSADCAAAIPSPPRQVSGNVHNDQVWTYMHPSIRPGGAPVNSYRVTVTDGAVTKQCTAAVYFQPNCIIGGLADHDVYWVTTQAHNRYGYSVPTDPEFVIPVTTWRFSAATAEPVIAQTSPVVVQVIGIVANSQGIYPTSVITVSFGSRLFYCHANPFGECLITIPHPLLGPTPIYATYFGYGVNYRSPTSQVTIVP